MTTHKDTTDSNLYSEQLGESVVPPQMIDSSAVLFSNTKRKTNRVKRNNVQNHLQSDIDKSEANLNDDRSIVEVNNKNDPYTQNGYTEGEYGEGESYSSSCSCSSCLREKNADNGVSLKLSQYSYKPTIEPAQKYGSEEESQYYENGNYQEDDISYDIAKNDKSGDFSPSTYPDNLNNGKYKMNMMG